MSTITVSDDSSVQESTSDAADHNVIRNENPVTVKIFSANSLDEVSTHIHIRVSVDYDVLSLNLLL